MSTEQHSFVPDEEFSALLDGQLPVQDAAHVLARMEQEPGASDAWHLYHVIGDALRNPELAAGPREYAFAKRLAQSLTSEPLHRGTASPAQAVVREPAQSANAAILRWKVGAGALFVCFLVVWGGQMWMPGSVDNVQTAQTVETPSTPSEMLRDPELDALLAAHQQMGGHSALQGPAGFVRNATFERPAR